MPTPTTSSITTIISPANSQNIDALLSLNKWGGTTGTGVALTYSFPWAAGNATFSGPFGMGNYSTANEQSATNHYGFNATHRTAAQAALQSWADVANINFQQVTDTASNVGDIRFAFSSAVEPTTWGYSYYPNSYWPSAGDIWVNTLNSGVTITNSPISSYLNLGPTTTNWSSGTFNYYSLIHEIGHAMGLKHPFEGVVLLPTVLDTRQHSVMSYTDPANGLFRTIDHNLDTSITVRYMEVRAETPMVLDIAAIQYMYGANMTYRTGDDMYSFYTSTPFYKTIWDAGGNDTISVSNFTENCRIDLTPGNYSSIRILPAPIPAGYTITGGTAPTYDGTNNLGIAYGAIIENATGGSGADTLIGNYVNNLLDGGTGADQMTGGLGNDTYVVDNAADITIETSALSTEIDTVQSSVTRALGANLEKLILTGAAAISGTGNALNNTLNGNAAANILDGRAGNDILNGGAGNDTLIGGTGIDWAYYNTATAGITISLALTTAQTSGGAGNDALSGIENLLGSNYNDTLTGDALANTLSGGAGIDTMIGGLGNDTYIVDNAGDVTTETSTLSTEIDTVQSSVTHTLGGNIEKLTLTGSAVIHGAGNTLNNTLIGNSAGNWLSGGTGADTMIGRQGNDTYIVDNVGDVTTETSRLATEIDAVQSSVTHTLGANIEKLTLIGSATINGTGNTLNNTLIGNAAANILNGGAGKDILKGGLGADRFYFGVASDTGIVSTTWDVITDFKSSELDKVDLSAIDSDVVTAGNQAFSFIGTAAFNGTNATGQLRFDSTAKVLYGSTDADSVAEFAIALNGVATLTGADFVL